MNRRGFLRLLGGAVAAAAAPTKAYSFLGGILRQPKSIVLPNGDFNGLKARYNTIVWTFRDGFPWDAHLVEHESPDVILSKMREHLDKLLYTSEQAIY